MERDGLSEGEALSRIRAVLSSAEKAARSQVVIDNSGSVSYTLSLLPALLEKERQLASAPRRRRSARYETEEASAPAASPSAPTPSFTARAELSAPAASSFPANAGVSSSPPPPTPQSLIPTVMERPAAAHRKRSPRKASWRLPFWMTVTLIVLFAVLLTGITAQSLMSAYLTRQAEKHEQEAQAILKQYPLEYRDLILHYAGEYNLSPAFVAAIIRNESSFQPRAESNVGARGLMQLMPDTAEWIAHKLKLDGYSFDRMWDPESNVRFGCWYLNYLSSLFQGDPVCVISAYHAGQGQVTAWLSDSSLTADGVRLNLDRLADGPTKSYARKVIKAYGIYQALYFDGADPYHVLLPVFGQ
jgi:soluble lytic murein transglycosylase